MDPRPAGLLRLPLLPDGAVGRAGRGGVHRRHPDRRGAGPQRPAARAVLGHRRRAGGARLRGRRAGHPRPRRSCRRAGCSRAGCSWPTWASTGSSPTTRSRHSLAAAAPYGEWLVAGRILLSDLPEREHVVHTHASVTRRQQVFGYTEEELRLILAPMATGGAEPIGSMGTDTPIAALSDKPRLLFDYFSQLFAQVTNPPLDAIREELVTSLYNTIGPERNLLDPGPASCRRLVLPFPVLDNDALAKIVNDQPRGRPARLRQTYVARGLYEVGGGADGADRQARRALRRDLGGDRGRRPDHRAVRPALQRRARADPVAAVHRGGAPPPGPGEVPHPGRSGGRGRRRPRGAPRRAADRLRRGGGQPVPGHRVRRGPGPARGLHQRRAGEGRDQRGQGARQGRAQGDEQDGRLHRRLLHRGADLRGARPVPGAGRPLLHRHHLQARRGHRGARVRRGGRAGGT